MQSIITAITFLSLWINISSIFNNIIIGSNEEGLIPKKNISLAFSLGFIFLFSSLGGLNILMHYFKIQIKYNHLLTIIFIFIFLLNKRNLINFYKYIKTEINSFLLA